MRNVRRRHLCLALLAAIGMSACREVAPKITGVRIVVMPNVSFDQITFGLRDEAGTDLFKPQLRPPDGGAPLSGAQDFVIYLDDDKGSARVACAATVWLKKQIVASGKTDPFTLTRQTITVCHVPLETADAGTTPDGGAPDGGAPETAPPDAGPPETKPVDAPDAAAPDVHDGGTDAPADQKPGMDGLLPDVSLDLLPDLGVPI